MLIKRESCYLGKKLSIVLLLFFIFKHPFFVGSGNYLFAQETPPDTTLKNYPGIPLVSYTYGFDQYKTVTDWQNADASGIFALEILNITNAGYTDFLSNTNFKIIADQGDAVTNNFIHRYTEARYTVWEAEGTPEQDGKATLYRDLNYTNEISDTTIATINTPVNTKILYGPSYIQEINYAAVDVNDIVNYTAEFKLRLEDIDLQLNPLPTDTICILRIYMAKIPWITGVGYDTTKIFTIDSVLTYEKFNHQWQSFYINYDLEAAWNYFNPVPITPDTNISTYRLFGISGQEIAEKKGVENLEYQIIWKGDASLVRLHIDKVILMDERGKDLFDPVFGPEIAQDIIDQIRDPNLNFNHRVVGWLGIDEPVGIDNFAPIKRVNEIVESTGSTMWIAFINWFYGRFWDPGHPMFTANLVRIDEFMRRVKKANIWMNYYMFDYPYSTRFPSESGTDWRIRDIDVITDSCYTWYKNAAELPGVDLFWGASVQTGRIKYPIYQGADYWRDIRSHDLLYTTNLALMSGAKLISPWLYFGGGDGVDWVYTGFLNPPINPFTPSDKYYTLKDTLVPRLNGLLGKTLKGLKASSQFAGSNGIHYDATLPPESTPGGYSYIENIIHYGWLPPEFEYGIDMGFFTDSINSDKRYFMILNRYYSIINTFETTLRDLWTYQNWNLKNYVDSTNRTLQAVNNKAEFIDTLLKGDANLYSIYPVVKDGGQILYNEMISGTHTLQNKMTIESGATLTVNGTYNINADIEVKDGGQLLVQPGTNLVFSNSAKLIVNGGLTAVGTAQNKITFDFTSQQSGNGIVADDEDFLTVTNCIIKNAVTGLNIMHRSRGTAKVKYSRFENCESGISLVNCTSALILGNEFINTELGVFTSNVSDLNIVSNQITTSYSESPAIFLNSSTGYVRKNTISGYQSGIEFGNSSPFLGANNIHHNRGNGLLIGPGSVPDLQGIWIRVPCTSVPIYSPLVGMNNIYENGGMTSEEWDNGAEVYIDYSSILLENGCNTIADDREELNPPYATMHLFSGAMADENPIIAGGNEWGYNPYYSIEERFDNLPVYYEPIGCVLPDNSIDCEFIVYTTENIPIDTFYTAYVTGDEENDLKELYAEAESYFTSEQYDQAKQIYNQIIAGYNDQKESLLAFTRLLIIERLQNGTPQSYETLKNFYSASLGDITDTVMIKVLNQLISLSLMNGGKLNDAANSFQDVIFNNPGSDEAAYAELDLYTTALLDTSNTLNKGGFEKVTVSSFNEKLSNFMRKRYGRSNSKTEQIIIPKEYSLYQNYPNPFNPATTIKFDLPKDGNVELIVYDILGRKITQLVNEYRSAGNYEHRFDASNLASGIYLYQLKSGDFVSTKKMMLVK